MRLTVRADSAATNVQLLDGAFNRVARAQGTLVADVPPGLYRVKFELGALVHTEDVEVEPSNPDLEIVGPPMLRASAAPLPGTETTHEYQQLPARGLSRERHLDLGGGAGLFLFAREAEDLPWTTPGAAVALHRPDGSLIVDLDRGVVDATDRYAGITLRLPQGTYLLRCQGKEGMRSLDMPVVVADGWQTQVFLRRADFEGPQGPARCVDVRNAAILMAPLAQGFEPLDEGVVGRMRLVEEARLALLSGNRISEGVDALLADDLGDPFLGLLGAHLLVVGLGDEIERAYRARGQTPPGRTRRETLAILFGSSESESVAITGAFPHLYERLILLDLPHLTERWDLVRRVVDRLTRPDAAPFGADVQALLLGLGLPTGPFTTPPMLRSGWGMVLEASLARPGLVPPGSWAGAVAEAVEGGGSWLTWDPARVADAPEPIRMDLRDSVRTLSSALRAGDVTEFAAGSLTEGDRRVLAAVSACGGSPKGHTEVATRSGGAPPDQLARLLSLLPGARPTPATVLQAVAQTLGVPTSVAEEAMGRVASKL